MVNSYPWQDKDLYVDYDKRIRWEHTICAWFAKWLQNGPTWWEDLYAPKSL